MRVSLTQLNGCCITVVEKRVYHGLPDLMTRVAREELDQLGDDVDECNVMYLPQV